MKTRASVDIVSIRKSYVKASARIMRKRVHRDNLFFTVKIGGNPIQAIVSKKEIENFDELANTSLGSVILIEGIKSTINSGQDSITVTKATIEAPCLVSLPDKFHGLSQEKRYQNRLIDFLINDETFHFMSKIASAQQVLRKFLWKKGYQEFNTGVLQKDFDSGFARPFVTHCNSSDKDYFLSLTSEIKLKKLIAAGFQRVFEISQSFRNEGVNNFCLNEYTLLEAYAVGTTLNGMINLSEKMIFNLFHELGDLDGINCDIPFCRISFEEMCRNKLGIDYQELNFEYLVDKYPNFFRKGMNKPTWVSRLINGFFAPSFTRPTFLIGIPDGCSPLVKSKNNGLSERAWFFIDSYDLADIYTDENNYMIIEEKIKKQAEISKKAINHSLLDLYKTGIPSTSGIGIGLNRLFMLYRKSLPENIKETVLFPLT